MATTADLFDEIFGGRKLSSRLQPDWLPAHELAEKRGVRVNTIYRTCDRRPATQSEKDFYKKHGRGNTIHYMYKV